MTKVEFDVPEPAAQPALLVAGAAIAARNALRGTMRRRR
jgi:hypothetical protein